MHAHEHLEDKSYNFIRVNAVVMNNSLVLGVIIPVLESSAYNISLSELKKRDHSHPTMAEDLQKGQRNRGGKETAWPQLM